MSKSIRLAAGQIVSKPADIEGNLAQIEALARQAAKQDARLILFAEGALTGYRFDNTIKAVAPAIDSPAVTKLQTLAQELLIVLAVGSVFQDAAGYHVSHLVVFPTGEIQVQHKHNLTPTELKHDIVPGEEDRIMFEVDGVTFGILICADGGIENIRNKLARLNCQVLLAPTAGGGGRDHMCRIDELEEPERWEQYLEDQQKVCFVGEASRQCWQHRMAIMACNLSGDDGVDNYHAGHSCIVDSRGSLRGLIPGEYVVDFLRPQLLVGDVIVQQPREWK